MRTWMWPTLPVLLVALPLVACGDSGSTFPTPTSTESNATRSGAGAGADASRGIPSDSGPPITCPGACPAMEPAEGDPCDAEEQCEYGGSLLLECNRVYFCSLGVFQKWKFIDTAAVCAPGMPAGCPSTRASVAAGGVCRLEGLRCAYMEGECDCSRGAWRCLPDNPQLGVAHCTVPRPRLGTACVPQSDSCEYEPICQAEACSFFCNRWHLIPFGVGCSMGPPMGDGGPLPAGAIDSGLARDGATDGAVQSDGAMMHDAGAVLDSATPVDAGTKPDGRAKSVDSGADH